MGCGQSATRAQCHEQQAVREAGEPIHRRGRAGRRAVCGLRPEFPRNRRHLGPARRGGAGPRRRYRGLAGVPVGDRCDRREADRRDGLAEAVPARLGPRPCGLRIEPGDDLGPGARSRGGRGGRHGTERARGRLAQGIPGGCGAVPGDPSGHSGKPAPVAVRSGRDGGLEAADPTGEGCLRRTDRQGFALQEGGRRAVQAPDQLALRAR